MLLAARVEARSRFNNNRSLPVVSMDTQRKINEAEEVARILRQNVVQGQKVEGNGVEDRRYRMYDLYTEPLVQQGYYNGWMEHEWRIVAKYREICRTSDSQRDRER